MTPYREDPSSQLAEFAKHVGVAEGLLGVNADLQQQLAIMTKRAANADRAYLETWRDLWVELDQARALLLKLGRDTSAFDGAKERAGNPRLVVGGFTPLSEPMRVAARDAITALRAAAPEVIITKLYPPAPVRIDPSAFALSNRWRLSPAVQIRLVFFLASLVVLVIVFALSR